MPCRLISPNETDRVDSAESLKIRDAVAADAAQIALIYNYYISNTIITFEVKEIAPATIVDRLHHVLADGFPWIVLENDQTIIGYAYATKFRDREAYRYTAESTVYLDPQQTGRGHGARLYRALLDRLKRMGIHVVIGVVSLPNPASVRLHESFGFTQTAHLQQVGFKFGQWIDVGDWQLIL